MNIRAALNTFATTAEAEAFVQEQLSAADRAGYERGRAEGRADVGKYASAVGRIESLVGLAGATPLSETVAEVARQLADRDRRIEELELVYKYYEMLHDGHDINVFALCPTPPAGWVDVETALRAKGL